MTKDSNDKAVSTKTSGVPTEINLGPSTNMDLSWLSEEERKELMLDYTKGMIDIGKRAQELHVDAAVLNRVLEDLSNTSREAAKDGSHVTITHSQTTKVGRTEVIMGNTDQAKSGKLTKSQTGESNYTPLYITGLVVAVIIIVGILSGS